MNMPDELGKVSSVVLGLAKIMNAGIVQVRLDDKRGRPIALFLGLRNDPKLIRKVLKLIEEAEK